MSIVDDLEQALAVETAGAIKATRMEYETNGPSERFYTQIEALLAARLALRVPARGNPFDPPIRSENASG